MRRFSAFLSLAWFCVFLSCLYVPLTSMVRAEDIHADEALVLIMLPVENVSVMYERFLPFKNYLEEKLARKIVLRVASNYQEAIEHIGTGKAHVAYLDPSAYCEAKHRYDIVPLAKAVQSGVATYRSVLVARSDSGIDKIIEARGKRLALGNKSSSSSYLIPAVMLKEVGIDLAHFSQVDFLEEEDRISLSVLTGRHDVGGVSESVARKYERDGLKIIKTSEAIPQFSFSVFPGATEELKSKLKSAFLQANKEHNRDLFTAMEDIEGFEIAEDRDFDVVRVMIRNLTGKNYLRYGKKTRKVAILPLYSAITLFDRFDPLMRYLSKRTGNEFKLVIPKDFETFFETISRGKVEYSYSNPYIYTQLADDGHLKAFANTIKPPTGDIFRGIVITHRDSKIASLDDLRGKSIMIVSPLSAAGYLAQKLYLLENGINVDRDTTIIDGKRQEEVILNVYRKEVDAGFVRESAPDVLKEEIDLRKIRILARTPYIPNWPFAATPRADRDITQAVKEQLVRLHDKDVLEAAKITGFKSADDHDFDTLRKWIKKHAKK